VGFVMYVAYRIGRKGVVLRMFRWKGGGFCEGCLRIVSGEKKGLMHMYLVKGQSAEFPS
jgi:hypothetical protein